MPTLLRRTLRPFGATLVLEADDRRVLDAADAALARYPRSAGVQASCSVTARTGADAEGDPAWPVTSVRFSDGRLELRCGSGVLDADGRAGVATLTLPPALLAVPDAVRMFVEGAASVLLINGGQLHAVHAGLVERAGRAVLLRGPSGAGKSTLTYSCLRRGWRVASDDWVYGVAGQPPDRLWGYPWRVFLVPEATARFPELAGRDAVLHPGADRLKVPIEPPVAQRRRSAEVHCVVFLDPGAELSLTAIDPDEAQRRFWGPALPTERSDLPPAWVERLLDRPCYVLARGGEPDEAAALLERLTLSSA
ncbi:MAG: HPr kinase/phosphorylase [Acidimicrobiales bacterium]